MKKVVKISAGLAMLVAICGLLLFFAFIGGAKGAPQEAALAAMTLAVVVPWYVIARCMEMLRGPPGNVEIK